MNFHTKTVLGLNASFTLDVITYASGVHVLKGLWVLGVFVCQRQTIVLC